MVLLVSKDVYLKRHMEIVIKGRCSAQLCIEIYIYIYVTKPVYR